MIDEKKLLKSILYADKWNNAPCPIWVIHMILAQPVFEAIDRVEKKNLPYDGIEDCVRHILSEMYTPAESCTHVNEEAKWEK